MNVDPATASLIQSILLFIGSIITVAGVIFAAVWARKSRRDRAPVDERDDMKAQFEAMSIANKTVVETMNATNMANDRIVRTLTDDKTRLDLEISEYKGQLKQREADMNRLYEQREKHIDEIERLSRESIELRGNLDAAVRRRDYLETELALAQQRIDKLTPDALQDEIAKQRQAHHATNTGSTPTEGGVTT